MREDIKRDITVIHYCKRTHPDFERSRVGFHCTIVKFLREFNLSSCTVYPAFIVGPNVNNEGTLS